MNQDGQTPTPPPPGEPGYVHERPEVAPAVSPPDLRLRLADWAEHNAKDNPEAARLMWEAVDAIAYLRGANDRLVGQERTIKATFERVKGELAALDAALKP